NRHQKDGILVPLIDQTAVQQNRKTSRRFRSYHDWLIIQLTILSVLYELINHQFSGIQKSFWAKKENNESNWQPLVYVTRLLGLRTKGYPVFYSCKVDHPNIGFLRKEK